MHPFRPVPGLILLVSLGAALAHPVPSAAQDAAPAPSTAPAAGATEELDVSDLQIPDVSLVDQDGKPVHFYSDLVRGKVVMMNFIFTSCTTICPPMGATFGKLQQLLGERAGRDVHLISVSVDPANDTPARLKDWAKKFGAGPGWTLVTGERETVVQLLKALGVYTPKISDHTPLVLAGNDARGAWTRAYGLAAPDKLVGLIDRLALPAAVSYAPSPGQGYFGEIPLVDQDGRTLRLYSDLLKGKTVVMDFMFTSCTGACPVMSTNFAKIQDWLGDRLGKDVYLLSFSVDPVHDTPARLKEYAARFKARPGWYFLTGSKENVDAALHKLGNSVATPQEHQNLFIIGNERSGLWKKAFGLAAPETLIPIVESVIDDQG